jgi:carboxyaminopropylagmatine decarboxylase
MTIDLTTPAFVVDAQTLARNAEILRGVKERTGCRILLALKAFSMPEAFPFLQDALDGTCASSVHEARLGHERFGGETHTFAAAFSEADMRELLGLDAEPGQKQEPLIQHITFNSFAQWKQFQTLLKESGLDITCGLRVNPEHSEGTTPLYDPCAPGSRLGVKADAFAGETLDGLTGLHVHNLCEQDADAFERTLAAFEEKFAEWIPQFKWFNFGGGHHITRPGYDVDRLCAALNGFKERHPGVTLYLEPGEACVLNAGVLVTTVLDVIHNDVDIAILDTSCVCHMPDVLEMPYRPRVFRDTAWDGSPVPGPDADRGGEADTKPHTIRLAGPSCLAGDVIGDYSFDAPLNPGDRLLFEDMALYTMVKTTAFNGIRLPTIVLRELDGTCRTIRTFGYQDFISRL